MFFARRFKNFDDVTLDLDSPVTLLVGPNGSGKSNLIEAVEMLSFLVKGRPLHEITDLGREGGLEVRGGLEGCVLAGESSFTLGCNGSVNVDGKARAFEYKITIKPGKESRVQSESLAVGDRKIAVFEILPIEDAEETSADNVVRYDNYTKGREKPNAFVAGDRSAISQYARFARGNRKLAEVLPLVDAVVAQLASPAVFDPIPKLMRNYERASETKLSRNGFNTSPVLFNLSQRRIRRVRDSKTGELRTEVVDQSETVDRILARIAQLPDEPFNGFDFVRTSAGDVMLQFLLPTTGRSVAARVLSDGTLRALAVITALETSPRGTRLIIEEFDNGVHPSRVQVLTKALFECSARNGLRTLVTTHNPAALNALIPEQHQSVLLVLHEKDTRRARVVPLTQLPGFIEFIEKGRLGDLITKRIYESHFQPTYEQDRKREIEKWIDELP